MDDPSEDLRADPEERSEAPDFDALASPAEVVRGGRTRDDFLDAVLGLGAPSTVDEVAELAGHGTDAAREYLEWFEQMGIVRRVTETPATYERNEEYLTWRRVQRLRGRYSTDELVDLLEEASERDRSFSESFDADGPNAVSIATQAAEADRSVESVWEDVSTWKTVRRRIALLERALATSFDGSADQRTSV